MSNSKFIEAWCKKKIKDLERVIVDDLPKEIAKDTQRNFNRVVDEIPADDPKVSVIVQKHSNNEASVVCSGNQVLFVEFGAGNKYKTKTSTVVRVGQSDVEYASRPAGIVGIGEYGQGRGKDDYWIYRGTRVSKNSQKFLKKPNKDLIITQGIRPVRALYRGIASGLRRITTKRIRRLGE